MSSPFNPSLAATTGPDTAKPGLEYYPMPLTLTMRLTQETQSLSMNVAVKLPSGTNLPTIFEFPQAMLGYARVTGSPGQLSRYLPERMQYTSGVGTTPTEETEYYCTECDLVQIVGDSDVEGSLPKGKPQFNNFPGGRYGIYQCTFSALPYPVLSDTDLGSQPEYNRFTFFRDEPNAHLERVPAGAFYLDRGAGRSAGPLGEVPAFRAQQMIRYATWMWLPQLPPIQYIKDCAYRVNDATFMGYSPETVLLLTHSKDRKTDVMGRELWNLTYQLNIRLDDRSWNKFWEFDAGVQTLREAKVLANGNPQAPVFGDKLFRSADFNKLFKIV